MHSLTERQQREREYHKSHAARVGQKDPTIDYDVIFAKQRRWWNAYWDTWTYLIQLQPTQGRILVVGCGAGEDALRLAKFGATVFAFDLSLEMLALGQRLARRDQLNVAYSQMPAEQMSYAAQSFDVIFVRDVFHHVDIPTTMKEIVRVAKPNALLVVNEIYSHSITNVIRKSWLVERVLYAALRKFVYGSDKPYITPDERKMTEVDVAQITAHLQSIELRKYFNFIVTRLLPDRYTLLCKLDRLVLWILGPLGYFAAGRIVFTGRLKVP